MSKKSQRRTAIIVGASAAATITAAVAYMIISTVSGGSALEYFKNVDEALRDLPKLRGQRLRLHGNVVKGTIQKKSGTLDYRFAVYAGDRWTEVTYSGLVPDTFKDCAEVVVKGIFSRDGHRFTADSVTAKCPSKYDEKQRVNGCGEKIKPMVLARRGQKQ